MLLCYLYEAMLMSLWSDIVAFWM